MNNIIGYMFHGKRILFVFSNKNTVIITCIIDDDGSDVKIENWFSWYNTHVVGVRHRDMVHIHVTK